MTEFDVYFKKGTSADPVAVKCLGITNKIQPAVTVLNPATFRVLKDIFGEQQLTSMLVSWGKTVLIFTFELYFSNDTEYKDFLIFVLQSFYLTKSDGPLEFYWGGADDPFYTGENTLKLGATDDKFGGLFLAPGSFTRDSKGGFWRGSIDFVLGETISL